jgi:hypothetical protein
MITTLSTEHEVAALAAELVEVEGLPLAVALDEAALRLRGLLDDAIAWDVSAARYRWQQSTQPTVRTERPHRLA